MELKNYLLTEQHSYTSFAKIVGVSRVTVMKWAKGRVMPRPLHVAELPAEPINYAVAVELAVGRPDRRKRDIDNINKATLDLLEHVGVLENDHYVHDLRSYWSDKVVGIQVIIKNLESTAASRALID